MAFIEKKKRKWGDNRDGIWLKDTPGLNIIMACLYRKRADCEVCLQKDLDITTLLKYIDDKNQQNPEIKTKLFHCIVTMMTRILNQRRTLNNFVRSGRIYQRDEILISFVAKRQFNDKAEEALVTYKAKANHTITDVSKFILGEVKEVRDPKKKKKDLNQTINKFAKMPRLLLLIFTGFILFLDKWGKVPKSFTHGDPAYSTLLISNLGSIKCPAVYHHLNNYGNNSLMMTLGTMEKRVILKEDGETETRDFVKISITADERIADGFYFARSIKMLDYLCLHPEILDLPFEQEVELKEE